MNRASSGLAGVWKLLFFEVRDAQGRLSSPLGSAPEGYLIYTKDGYVSALVTAGRTATNGTAGAMERGGAVKEYAYHGKYETRPDCVVHNVFASLPRGLAGCSLKYLTQREDDRLIHIHYGPSAFLGGRAAVLPVRLGASEAAGVSWHRGGCARVPGDTSGAHAIGRFAVSARRWKSRARPRPVREAAEEGNAPFRAIEVAPVVSVSTGIPRRGTRPGRIL